MSISNGNGNGGGLGEPIPRYMNPSTVGSTSVLPDRRRRGKNLGGNYYGSSGPRNDGRYHSGGNSYPRSHRGGGGGDGPHNGSSNYHHHRGGGQYDSQQQQHSPTDSHTSSRSGSHHHNGQDLMSQATGQQQHHHYHQQHHSHHQHQYHQPKQDYDNSGRLQEYRSQRGGDQHTSHNQHHHHHNHGNHFGSHHHRINVQTQQQQHPDVCPAVNSHSAQSSVGGYVGGNGGSPQNHQTINATTATTDIAVISQPPQEHVYPTANASGNAGPYQQPNGQLGPTTMLQQYPGGITTAGPPGPPATTLGYYGYHTNSQPMFGSLALCHIPYGINPSSVISPVVYTQIIGSGVLAPGLPYNLTCGIPTPFLQAATAAPMILQPPQQHPQTYPQQPHYHHHYHPHSGQYSSAGGQPMPNTTVVTAGMGPSAHQTLQPHNQGEGSNSVMAVGGGDDGVLFDSSSLLNPDADAFFPPAFPPSAEGVTNEVTGNLTEVEGMEEDQIVIVDDEEEPAGLAKLEREIQLNSGENSPKIVLSNVDDDVDDDGNAERDCGNVQDEGDEENEKCNISGTSKNSSRGDGSESN